MKGGVQSSRAAFKGSTRTQTLRGNTSRIDDDGCAPGMVIWVLASHNRRRAMLRVPPTLNTGCGQKLPGEGSILFGAAAKTYEETAASAGSLDRRHHFSSWLNSVISMPGMTMNLQLNISRGSSSSGN